MRIIPQRQLDLMHYDSGLGAESHVGQVFVVQCGFDLAEERAGHATYLRGGEEGDHAHIYGFDGSSDPV